MKYVYETIERRLREDFFYQTYNDEEYLMPYNFKDENIGDAIDRYCDDMGLENYTYAMETLFENCSYEVGYLALSYIDELGLVDIITWKYEVM
jgi:hypothetical protein